MDAHQAQEFFTALAVIVTLAQLLGRSVRRLGQPPVVGEMLAGILVGPSLLGGAVAERVFPADVRPQLAALAGLGLALFMFAVGRELDFGLLRGNWRLTASIALGSAVVPALLGSGLALLLPASRDPAHRTGFALFLGAAMSVTAFPVLARILTDRKVHHTGTGTVALAAAAANDVFAWALLAAVTTLVSSSGGQWHALLFPVYAAVMWLAIRPLLRRLLGGERGVGGDSGTVVVLAGLTLSCGATEWMGIHFVFGAFLFGAIMPRSPASAVPAEAAGRPAPLNRHLLLPVYFVVAGLRVDLSRTGWSAAGEFAVVLLTAVAGKAAGAYAAARLNKVPARQAAVLAALMNTRGLTEIVILTVGLQLGIIDTRLYSLMVVMALVTTAMAGPAVRLLWRDAGDPGSPSGEEPGDRQSALPLG